MTANGQPDGSRAARYILKDFMNGKLLYCHAPPNIDQAEYFVWPERQKTLSANKTVPPRAVRAVKASYFERNVQIINLNRILALSSYNRGHR